MKLQNSDFPRTICIKVPRGRDLTFLGQSFSTDDLPERLIATFVTMEEVKIGWRNTILAKYSVEPIFSVRMIPTEDDYGIECYNQNYLNKLCRLILQPDMIKLRSAVLQDEFVVQRTEEDSYWICTPGEKYKATFSENGILWQASVLGCESGYYYEYYSSEEDDRIFRKVGKKSQLMKKPRAVKPIVYYNTKAFARVEEIEFAFA